MQHSVLTATPNSSDRLWYVSPFLFLLLISIACFSVILLTLLSSPGGVRFFNPVRIACCVFSFAVHHSKFSNLLSCLIPFMWFTCGLSSGFGIKHSATARWTIYLRFIVPFRIFAIKYPCPLFSNFSIFSRFPRQNFILFTRPRLLTIYLLSACSVFHSSFIVDSMSGFYELSIVSNLI